MALQYRRAGHGDRELVRSLYAGLTADLACFDACFNDVLTDSHSWPLIVEQNGRPVAMAFCHEAVSLSAGRSLVLDELVVVEEARGRGLGTQVMADLLQMGADQGFSCLTLGCSLSRPALHRFYETNGLAQSGRVYSRRLGS